jgi:uncharacterized protein YbjT (DUF2867 family)
VRIVVLGGTGLIGSRLKQRLRADWHDVVVASPSTGVDAVTGEGLVQALEGAEVVYDVSNAPSWEDQAVLNFFESSSRRVLAVEAANRTWHHIALSVVGADRMGGVGYMRAKVAQENVIRESGRAYTIVRATQFFELASGIADTATEDGVVLLPSTPVQPIAADDVAAALAELAQARPRNGIVNVAGPAQMPLHEFVARALPAVGDTRCVHADESARYFGARLEGTALVPGPDATLGATTLAQWLRDVAGIAEPGRNW